MEAAARHNRDVSVLLYLNDKFSGGNLHFPTQNVEIRPEPGLFVAFPSSYLHAALPVDSGERLVIVSWSAAIGTSRIKRAKPPA